VLQSPVLKGSRFKISGAGKPGLSLLTEFASNNCTEGQKCTGVLTLPVIL
jgi:hypothetical protein